SPFSPSRSKLPVNGIAHAKLDGTLLHGGFDGAVALVAPGGKSVEHLDDHAADLLELGNAETARGARRRAQTHAGGDRGLLRIEGHAVLVAGDVGAAEGDLGSFAGEFLGPEIDKHQMRVG